MCRLEDFDAGRIEMVGTEPISGLRCDRDITNGEAFRTISVPIFPSDHYNLLLNIKRNRARGSDEDGRDPNAWALIVHGVRICRFDLRSYRMIDASLDDSPKPLN